MTRRAGKAVIARQPAIIEQQCAQRDLAAVQAGCWLDDMDGSLGRTDGAATPAACMDGIARNAVEANATFMIATGVQRCVRWSGRAGDGGCVIERARPTA